MGTDEPTKREMIIIIDAFNYFANSLKYGMESD